MIFLITHFFLSQMPFTMYILYRVQPKMKKTYKNYSRNEMKSVKKGAKI